MSTEVDERYEMSGNVMLALKGRRKLPECMALAGFTEEEVANRSLQQRVRRLKEKIAKGKVP